MTIEWHSVQLVIFATDTQGCNNVFSRGTPNLPVVIPAIDHIDTTFTGYTLPGSEKPPAIHAAVEVAKKTLNKYYSLTDSSELYRIAMGMI